MYADWIRRRTRGHAMLTIMFYCLFYSKFDHDLLAEHNTAIKKT